MLIKTLANFASPAANRGRLSTLIFHRVVPAPDALFPGEMDARRFDDLCAWIGRHFNVLPLIHAVDRLRAGSLPERALAITFDDGYADNHDVAMPILRRHGLSATFFIATGFLDGGRMWNDTLTAAIRLAPMNRLALDSVAGADFGSHDLTTITARRAAIDSLRERIKYVSTAKRQAIVDAIAERAGAVLPTDLMLTSDQVRGLRRGGMEIGAHTVSHPILAKLDRAEVRREIGASKERLEEILSERVSLFAYPNGKPGNDYNDESVAVARELGFDAAVSTAWGAADAHTDLFQIPRFTPWDRAEWRFGLRLVGNLMRSRG